MMLPHSVFFKLSSSSLASFVLQNYKCNFYCFPFFNFVFLLVFCSLFVCRCNVFGHYFKLNIFTYMFTFSIYIYIYIYIYIHIYPAVKGESCMGYLDYPVVVVIVMHVTLLTLLENWNYCWSRPVFLFFGTWTLGSRTNALIHGVSSYAFLNGG